MNEVDNLSNSLCARFVSSEPVGRHGIPSPGIRLTTNPIQICKIPSLEASAPFTTAVEVVVDPTDLAVDQDLVVSSMYVVMMAIDKKEIILIPQFAFKVRLTFVGGWSREIEVRWMTIKGMCTIHISPSGDNEHDVRAALPLQIGTHMVVVERGAMWRIPR